MKGKFWLKPLLVETCRFIELSDWDGSEAVTVQFEEGETTTTLGTSDWIVIVHGPTGTSTDVPAFQKTIIVSFVALSSTPCALSSLANVVTCLEVSLATELKVDWSNPG